MSNDPFNVTLSSLPNFTFLFLVFKTIITVHMNAFWGSYNVKTHQTQLTVMGGKIYVMERMGRNKKICIIIHMYPSSVHNYIDVI